MEICGDLLHLGAEVIVAEERRDRDDESADSGQKGGGDTWCNGIDINYLFQ